MSVTTKTIADLCVSPFNARIHLGDANAVSGMEDSLLARGQLYPLVVHPMKVETGQAAQWGAIEGGRRLRAFNSLIAKGKLPANHPIDVIIRDIRDEGELRELSLAGNLVRLGMRHYEVFAAVAAAHDKGRSIKDIAETNGQPFKVVEGWIRLGNLHPTVFAALVANEISEDQAKAYAATADIGLQLHVFEQLRHLSEYQRTPAHIRKALKFSDRELEKLLRFVGEANYGAAGGRYELDLYAEQVEQRGRVEDEGLLLQLADAKIDAARALLRTRTGRILRFEKDYPQDVVLGGAAKDLEVLEKILPLGPEDEARIEYLDLELTELQDQADKHEGEWSAEQRAAADARETALVAELNALVDRRPIELPEGDVFATLVIQEDGSLEYRFWWADRKAKRKAEDAARKQPDAPPPRPVSTGPNPKPLAAAAATGQQPMKIRAGAAIREYGARQKADALIREEHGLTADGVQAMRSIRREVLRAAMLIDARDKAGAGAVALDYLLWGLARDRLDHKGGIPGTHSTDRGIAGLSIHNEQLLDLNVTSHVDRTAAHAIWKEAVAEVKGHVSMTEKDLVMAFEAFRDADWHFKSKATAVIAGCAIERSAAAAGYEVALHDRVAFIAGYGEDAMVRTLVEPTDEMLDLAPTRQRLALVHPHISNSEYLRLEKLKAADLSAPVVRALKRLKDWVFPMLRFDPAKGQERMVAMFEREAAE